MTTKEFIENYVNIYYEQDLHDNRTITEVD